jgi:hypothetical protein
MAYVIFYRHNKKFKLLGKRKMVFAIFFAKIPFKPNFKLNISYNHTKRDAARPFLYSTSILYTLYSKLYRSF